MTVCIAALCGSTDPQGPYIVAASDRMITIGDVEYEPAQTKSVDLASQTIALLAGDMQLHAAVVPRVIERIRQYLAENPTNINVSEIAEFYAEEFGYYRRSMAEKEILIPRGMNFDRYLARQATMAHYQVADLDARLASYWIDAVAIVCGLDPTGGHIYVVSGPGVAVCYDTTYFAAIGSGAALANTHFMVRKFDKTWNFPSSLWLTFEAKARAEYAGGVGKETDIHLIGRGGILFRLKDDQKKFLYKLFDETMKAEKRAADKAAAKIDDYIKKLAPASGNTQQAIPESADPGVAQESGPEKEGRRSSGAQVLFC